MADAMKISVLLPSRGRPESLAATVIAISDKHSGANDVRYVIGCDADDSPTIEMALAMRQSGLPVVPHVASRQPTLGGLDNLLAARCPADVYCVIGDDFHILTPEWDRIVADAWIAKPDGVWWWSGSNTRNDDATAPIISEKWRAAAGRIFTEYFPFWWDDLWLVEVLRYATGKIGAERLDIWLHDRASTTHRMRDSLFWHDFFWSRRDERKEEARMIAERLCWPRVASLDGLDIGKNPDFDPADIEAKQGERGPPTPEYLCALAHAKALMSQQKEAA